MAFESRWFDGGTVYNVLAMDPMTSGLTWAQVTATLNAGDPLPATVYQATWVKEKAPVTQAAHLDMCKTETIRLAQLALAPATPATVTLNS
jgi:hypothetical protein